MKSMKLIGLSLLALFALGAFAASASAEEGFLPTSKANILGGASTLETKAGSKIKCEKLDESAVTFTNDKTATATLHWSGCRAEGLFAVNSTGDAAEVILVKVKFLVCLDPKSSAGTLVDEFGVAGEVEGTAKLEVPAAKAEIEVKGTALGAVLTTGKAKLFSVEFLAAAAKEGKQAVTECLQGTTKIVHNLLANKNKGAFEAASENVVGGLIQFEKETELMDS